MFYFLLILSLFVLIRTLSYGYYEWKQEENKIAGITIGILGIVEFIVANIVFFLN